MTGRRGRALRFSALLLAAAAFSAVGAASAEEQAAVRRFVSINMCTDQLLLALADPEQILGLSPFARDAARSAQAGAAARHPILSGTAEEVMVLKPDLVLTSPYTALATRQFLKARGIALADFAPVSSIADSREQITRAGALTGHPDRAAALVARIDAGLAAARLAAAAKLLRVLPVQRRGWVAGRDTLMTDLLHAVGLTNAGAEIGGAYGALAPLERIVALKPDAILTTGGATRAEDQGRAFLLHPALRGAFPPDRVIIVPERMTVCGGPEVADALEHLAREISRIGLR